MGNRPRIVPALLAGLVAQALPAAASQLTPVAGFAALLDSAETVVAGEILRVDGSATAADGPLILEVKVLGVPKGRVAVGQTLRTWEAAQVAGTYHVGERRLMLLKRQFPIEPYHRQAAWWNMPTSLTVFVEKTALDQLTLEGLQQWLHELTTAERVAPTVGIRWHGRIDEVLTLTVMLTNTSQQVIRLNPSCVAASFDVAQRHFIPLIEWETSEAGAWLGLEPGKPLSGTLSVDVRLPDDMTTLPVMIGHLCLSFPSPRTWVGYLTTEVSLSAMEP